MAELMFRKHDYESAIFNFQQLLDRKPGRLLLYSYNERSQGMIVMITMQTRWMYMVAHSLFFIRIFLNCTVFFFMSDFLNYSKFMQYVPL